MVHVRLCSALLCCCAWCHAFTLVRPLHRVPGTAFSSQRVPVPADEHVFRLVPDNGMMCLQGPGGYLANALARLRASPLARHYTGVQVALGKCDDLSYHYGPYTGACFPRAAVYVENGPRHGKITSFEESEEVAVVELKLACGEGGVERSPRSPSAASLNLPKKLWASGFDAKFHPVPEQAPEEALNGRWLTWNSKAERIFARRYQDIHFPAEGCRARAEDVGYYSARTDMEWGLTSVIRDVEDQLLYGLLQGRFVAFSRSVSNEPLIEVAMQQYREGCQGEGVWIEDCYFENLTGCTDDYLHRRLPLEIKQLDRRTFEVTSEPDWFLRQSQPIWDEMVAADAVGWQGVGGPLRPSSTAVVEPPPLDAERTAREAAQRLAMFRALLLRVAFRPNQALQDAIRGVERRTKLPDVALRGPLTLVHARRTDKSRDFWGGAQTRQEKRDFKAGQEIAGTLSTFTDELLPWLEEAKGPISGLFVMSDDWHMFEPAALRELTRKLETPPREVVYDPFSAELEPKDDRTLQMGNEAWGNKVEVGRYILAASFAAGKWGDRVLGCGSSGVTQLVAQLIGGRLGLDPNALGLWEDDAVGVGAARSRL